MSAAFIEICIGFRDSLKGALEELFGVDGSDGLNSGWEGGPCLQQSDELGTAAAALLLDDHPIGKSVRPRLRYAPRRG
jgi:hypothetical protein